MEKDKLRSRFQFSESLLRTDYRKVTPPFNLTPEDILPQLELGVCEVTGIRFVSSNIPKVRGPFVASLDRKIASKGYTKGNVQVVIWALNAMRGNWGDKILLQVARALSSR